MKHPSDGRALLKQVMKMPMIELNCGLAVGEVDNVVAKFFRQLMAAGLLLRFDSMKSEVFPILSTIR